MWGGCGSGKHVIWERDEGTRAICLVKAKVPAGSNLVEEGLFNKCPGNTYCMLSSALDARNSKNQMDMIPTIR